MKILDCTLRDGGYYTDWNYSDKILKTYFDGIKNLPIDIIEIGYIGAADKNSAYKGKFYYLSPLETKKIKKKLTNKKIALMVDTKDWSNVNVFKKTLLNYCGIVDIIRFAVDWRDLEKYKKLIKCAKNLKFQVCANLMYCHELLENKKFESIISSILDFADVIYFVDSYGSLLPGQLTQLVQKFKTLFPKKKFGFHSHNNLELALSNSVEAIKNGAYIIDSTITGMGRGAGNLKTELLLSYLKNLNINKKINFDLLDGMINEFEILKNECKWGTSLPYMLSGSNKIPQSNVIKFIKSRRLNYSDLLLYNQKRNNSENKNLLKNKNKLNINYPKENNVLLVGGGSTVKKFNNDIVSLIKKNKKLTIIFAGSKNIKDLMIKDIKNKTYLCLGGSDYNKNKLIINKYKDLNFLLFENNISINLKENLNRKYFLKSDRADNDYQKNSPIFIAFKALESMKSKNIFLIGFDGYNDQKDEIYSNSLNEENQNLINFYASKMNLNSLTPTTYKGLKPYSLFKELLKSDNSLSSL